MGQSIAARTVTLNKSTPTNQRNDAVVIKKYANRRLYNTETSTYVTLDDLAQMVRSDRDFVVRDAKTGDDLTHAVLTQIIVEQEGRAGGATLLPIPFLRQLIRYYDDSVGKLVPGYLQFSLETLTKEHERFRAQLMNNPWGAGAFEAYQDQARRNLAIFEKAMGRWSPFGGTPGSNGKFPEAPGAETDAEAQPSPRHSGVSEADATKPAPGNRASQAPAANASGSASQQDTANATSEAGGDDKEINQLKAELAAMQKRIENLSRSS